MVDAQQTPAPDARRQRRHVDTREQIVAHALAIMTTEGVLGLSLGEIARRLGVRTPSLYTYVDSKNALYDELFRRGWQACHDDFVARAHALGPVTTATDVRARACDLVEASARWYVGNPALTQLMLFRPVPQWEPTASAYAPAVAVWDLLVAEVAAWHACALLRPDADLDELANHLANVTTGVVARHLGNEPHVPFGEGRAERSLAALTAAVVEPYATVLPR